MRDCQYRASPIGYWDNNSTVGPYKVLRFFLLVTVCCDNSGFSEVVTLKSPVGFLPCRFLPIENKSPSQFYFPLHINLVGDLFVLPHVLHVN